MPLDPNAVASDTAIAPATSIRGQLFVLQTGLATTALALGGVYWLSHYADTDPMGWYGGRIIPAGAICVGTVAGSGYGAASWWTGVKIGRGLLYAVCALLIVAYFVAQFINTKNSSRAMRNCVGNCRSSSTTTSVRSA